MHLSNRLSLEFFPGHQCKRGFLGMTGITKIKLSFSNSLFFDPLIKKSNIKKVLSYLIHQFERYHIYKTNMFKMITPNT